MRPGINPVKTKTRIKITRNNTGSTLKYSPRPPQTPNQTLLFSDLYNLFIIYPDYTTFTLKKILLSLEDDRIFLHQGLGNRLHLRR